MQRAMLLGMWWAFIVEPRDGLPQYDRKYTLLLHETAGLYTINGYSFPKTLEDSLLKIKTGERILIRMINAGQQHHPMPSSLEKAGTHPAGTSPWLGLRHPYAATGRELRLRPRHHFNWYFDNSGPVVGERLFQAAVEFRGVVGPHGVSTVSLGQLDKVRVMEPGSNVSAVESVHHVP